MANLTDFAEDKIRQYLFRTGTPAKPAAWYIGLFSAMPGETGGGTEISGSNYSRPQRDPSDANWTAASSTNGLTDNAAPIDYPVPSGSWGTAVGMAFLDALSGGNMWLYGALLNNRTIGTGEQASYALGDLDVVVA